MDLSCRGKLIWLLMKPWFATWHSFWREQSWDTDVSIQGEWSKNRKCGICNFIIYEKIWQFSTQKSMTLDKSLLNDRGKFPTLAQGTGIRTGAKLHQLYQTIIKLNDNESKIWFHFLNFFYVLMKFEFVLMNP